MQHIFREDKSSSTIDIIDTNMQHVFREENGLSIIYMIVSAMVKGVVNGIVVSKLPLNISYAQM